jgi:MFS family permease
MVIMGLGFGLFQTPNNSAIMGNVPPENRGTASGTLATMRNSGMALGVALSGALFSFFEARSETVRAAQGLSGTALSDRIFADALQYTFLAAAGMAILAMTASLVKGNVKTAQQSDQKDFPAEHDV